MITMWVGGSNIGVFLLRYALTAPKKPDSFKIASQINQKTSLLTMDLHKSKYLKFFNKISYTFSQNMINIHDIN